MKKLAFASIALIVITGCTANQTMSPSPEAVAKTATAQNLTEQDRKKVKKDKRGHHARPMSQNRFEHLLEEYNANNDDKITWGEYNDWRQARFNKTDSNANGSVGPEEYVYEYENRLDQRYEKGRVAQIKLSSKRFDDIDKNNNGTIELAEYKASSDRIFSRWDTNNDGTANESDPKSDQKSKYQWYSKKSISFIRMPSSHTFKGLKSIFDANEDGEVSREEFSNSRRSTFYLTDENRDGKLSADEYLAEFEDRLDQTINSNRRGQIKQTYVRFGALDDNKDNKMTFEEFQISGKRIFTRWDKNDDNLISTADIGE